MKTANKPGQRAAGPRGPPRVGPRDDRQRQQQQQLRRVALEKAPMYGPYRVGEFAEVGNNLVRIEPDIIMSVLYHTTRRANGADEQMEEKVSSDITRHVVGTLLGKNETDYLSCEDWFVNGTKKKDEQGNFIELDHHNGVLVMRSKAGLGALNNVVGMIVNTLDMDVVSDLHSWAMNRNQSKFAASAKLWAPVIVCIDTELTTGRLDIRAYQKDRNAISFLQCPVTIGTNYPKCVLTALNEEDSDEEENSEEQETTEPKTADRLESTLTELASAITELRKQLSPSDVGAAREVYNALCLNPLMKEGVSEACMEKVTGDAMAMSYLLRLTELQAEIAMRLSRSF